MNPSVIIPAAPGSAAWSPAAASAPTLRRPH